MLKFINSLLHYLTFEASLISTSSEIFVLNSCQDIAMLLMLVCLYMPFAFIGLFLVKGYFASPEVPVFKQHYIEWRATVPFKIVDKKQLNLILGLGPACNIGLVVLSFVFFF
jgi:hypothetical protein